jgi:hypothetical protein
MVQQGPIKVCRIDEHCPYRFLFVFTSFLRRACLLCATLFYYFLILFLDDSLQLCYTLLIECDLEV